MVKNADLQETEQLDLNTGLSEATLSSSYKGTRTRVPSATLPTSITV